MSHSHLPDSYLMNNLNSIRQIHDAFDMKKLSPSELTQIFFQRIKASSHNAYITLCEDRALQQAQVAEAQLQKTGKVDRVKTPLLGIPLGIKDLLTIEGVRTTAASKILENYIPPYTATSVERLEAAGAVILGKLNMDEFAMGGSNENSAFGPVLHPTHAGYVAGGSSGGSAAAVRARLCHASLGSDTGGSIRLPASFCGVVGLKPTYGRISRYGQIAFASSLDQIGPLTHSVEDAALLLDVMSGYDPMDSTSSNTPRLNCRAATQSPVDWKRLKVGVPKEYFGNGLAPGVEQAIQKSLAWLEAQGAQMVPVSLPHTPYSVAVYYLVAVSEASSNLARFDGIRFGSRPSSDELQDLMELYTKTRSLFGSEVKRRIILGTFALSSGNAGAYYKRACQVRALIKKDFAEVFKKVDLLVGPVSPTTAFKLGGHQKNPLQMYLNDLFTIPVNLAGLPAVSVPCGEDATGLPIGLHIIGQAFADEQLLSAAQSFSQSFSTGKVS